MQNLVSIELLLSLSGIFLVILIVEAILHNRRVNAIKLRISVSGTRGKTTVVRMLASVLRESGFKVMAKTTGTEAMYILPDGSHEKIKRFGLVNILEQKALFKKVRRNNADCLVTELMSIQAENHRVESNKLVRAHYTVITNFRPDHVDVASRTEMINLYLNDIYPGSTLVLPAEEMNDDLEALVQKRGVKVIEAASTDMMKQNQELVRTLALELKISPEHIREGIRKSEMDKGQLLAFEHIEDDKKIVFVNAFAANDPVSSELLMDEVKKRLMMKDPEVIALLSFRADRGERSKQWLNYLTKGGAGRFNKLYFMGIHGRVFKRRLKRGEVIMTNEPDEITRKIIQACTGDTIVFGLMNIKKAGISLLDHWSGLARKVDLFSTDYQ